ncbi:MAG: histidine phosphatase family protein [Candidatus Diapherotrites archaeon]|nr:histidine phosphatase family protein [Candidatus Diapherotrites archaeon]
MVKNSEQPAKVVIHIFRHGERPLDSITSGNLTVRGRTQGTAIGKTLANELGKTKTQKIVKFYASPVGRNMQFQSLIRGSLMRAVRTQKLPVKVLASRAEEKFKYGKIRDQKWFDALYGDLSLEEFNQRWIQGKTHTSIVEQPAEVLARIRRNAEEFGVRVSGQYTGRPVEVHIVIVTHGDLMGVLREQITRRQAMLGKQKTKFGERIKLTLRGRKGAYETRGFKKTILLRRPK